MLFDTHAHYDAQQFDTDREEVLAALPESGVGLVVNPGCDLESSAAAADLAARHGHVYAAAGYHPENCAPYGPGDLDRLRELAGLPKTVAIGEIGLDYHWEDNPPKDLQREVFRAQMALAEELDLPVIVHDRDAHADAMAVVRDFPRVRGVFHCFSGSAQMARDLVKLGWMISFTGVLTYPNARRAVEAAAAVPLDRLMIETDSPYMSPVPCRGSRNDSRRLGYICQRLAEIKGISPEECARITAENGRRFFQIP